MDSNTKLVPCVFVQDLMRLFRLCQEADHLPWQVKNHIFMMEDAHPIMTKKVKSQREK